MRFVFSAVLAVLAQTAQAACPGETQLELNECAAAEYRVADNELNAAWAATKPRMDAVGAGPQLLDAQRKWIAFRDAACTAEAAPYSGGSIQPLIWYACLTRLAARRTEDIRGLLQP